MTEVLCDSCSEPAMRVDQNRSAEHIVTDFRNGLMACPNCQALGRVKMIDDGEQAMLVFRTEVTR